MPDEAQPPYRVPFFNRLMRRIMAPIFRALYRLLGQVRLYGMENIPQQGPYMIAMNHVSLFDVPFVLAFWPIVPEAAGAVDIWSRPGQATLARLYGGIQVHRGQYDRSLMQAMLSALQAGYPLLIAPEGRRSHGTGMQQALPGLAYVVDKARVPVVPVGVVGLTDDFMQRAVHLQHPVIEMRVGAPLHLPAIEGRGEQRRLARQQNIDQVMRHIAALLPADYQGIYTSPSPNYE